MIKNTRGVRLIGETPVDLHSLDKNPTQNLLIEDVPLGDPGEQDAVIEPLYVGVCGSDVHAALGEANFSWVERPRTLGHEFAGRVISLGDRVTESGLAVGDIVTAIPQRGCGDPQCRGCRNGRWNYCRRKKIFGFHSDGAMADRAVLEADRLVPLRYGLSLEAGALVEPLSVVAQAIDSRCVIQPGMDVVVSGCGIIGLMAAELARAAGARVAVTGLDSDRGVRLAVAEQRGFIPIVVSAANPLQEQLAAGIQDTRGHRFGDGFEDGLVDLIIECSGAAAALAKAPMAVRPEGRICVIATYPTPVPLEATTVTRTGQTVVGVMGSNREDFETAMRLLRDGVFDPSHYVKLYRFDDALQAFADSMTASVAKAVIQVSQ